MIVELLGIAVTVEVIASTVTNTVVFEAVTVCVVLAINVVVPATVIVAGAVTL